MEHIALLAVGLLGGLGALLGLGVKIGLKVASDKLPGLLGMALTDIEKHPEVKSILIANRPALEALLDQLDAAVKGNLDSQK